MDDDMVLAAAWSRFYAASLAEGLRRDTEFFINGLSDKVETPDCHEQAAADADRAMAELYGRMTSTGGMRAWCRRVVMSEEQQ
jgi:hypothetical protein